MSTHPHLSRPLLPLLAVTLLPLLALLPHYALAWGKSGHSLTGRVAFHLLSNSTKLHLKAILPNVAGDISLISSWADRVKRLPRYANTGPWHYSDAHDNPPFSCSYSYTRDCPNGQCVIAAIRNMTQILLDNRNDTLLPLSPPSPASRHPPNSYTDLFHMLDTVTSHHRFSVIADRRRQRRPRPRPPGQSPPNNDIPVKYTPAEALKFLVHLVQDVHQPLHLSGRDKGGNEALTKFNGHIANLHVVWDSLMLEKALADDYRGSEVYLAETLLTKMRVDWEPEVEEWTTCPASLPSLNPPLTAVIPPDFQAPVYMVMCPEHWAKGIDMLNCNNVWRNFSPTEDLANDYYRENLPVVLKSIAMGGARLAALLEAIFNPNRIV